MGICKFLKANKSNNIKHVVSITFTIRTIIHSESYIKYIEDVDYKNNGAIDKICMKQKYVEPKSYGFTNKITFKRSKNNYENIYFEHIVKNMANDEFVINLNNSNEEYNEKLNNVILLFKEYPKYTVENFVDERICLYE